MYSRFLVIGEIKGLLGFEVFDSGIYLGRKILQVFFVWLDFSRDIFGGIQSNLKIRGNAPGVVPVYPGCIVLQIKDNPF